MNTRRSLRVARRQTARAWAVLLSGLVILLLISQACSLTSPGQDAGLAATNAVLDQKMTQIAQANDTAMKQTQMALDLKSTMIVMQEQELAKAATSAAQQAVVPPTAPPPPTEPPAAPTPIPLPAITDTPLPSPTPNYDDMIKNANILLYEDIAGYYNLTRWVRDALNDGGYKYTDVGDAVGNFKAEILSGKKWDLVIAAAESRMGFQGELFEYLADAANKGTAVIIETWYLDYMAAGPISRITGKCGVGFQKNWMNPDRDSRSVIWLNPDHPMLHYPNEGFTLVHYNPYWEGDAGDMMYKKSSGDGEIIAGLYSTEKSRYGTLAVCYEGRVVIMTVSTHDYRKSDMTALWQNMTYYTLKNHFMLKGQQP